MRLTPVGLYMHVPFCSRTCDYCAFYQGAPTAEKIRSFQEGMEQECHLLAWPDHIETVFWGGGTPGLLSAKDLHRLGLTARSVTGKAPVEWSVEMTPLSVTDARLEALGEAGVNRLSIGVQSFDSRLLKALGRDHGPEQALRAYERARNAGFNNINLDLMFALPGQDDDAWLADLDRALALEPEHISTYCLTFEEDTKLWVKLSEGRLRRDIEAEARLYEKTWERLAAAGYAQYEISNFAKPGKECIHNLNTWRMHEWIGLGPSAASQYGGARGSNASDQDQWQKDLERGLRAREDATALSGALLVEDALIFGLRMNQGVDIGAWKLREPGAFWTHIDRELDGLVTAGLCEQTGGRIRLTGQGRLLADAVGERLVGLAQQVPEAEK